MDLIYYIKEKRDKLLVLIITTKFKGDFYGQYNSCFKSKKSIF